MSRTFRFNQGLTAATRLDVASFHRFHTFLFPGVDEDRLSESSSLSTLVGPVLALESIYLPYLRVTKQATTAMVAEKTRTAMMGIQGSMEMSAAPMGMETSSERRTAA